MPNLATKPTTNNVYARENINNFSQKSYIVTGSPLGNIADPVSGEPSSPHFQSSSLSDLKGLEELNVTYDAEKRALWWCMTPSSRPSFTLELLRDMKVVADTLESVFSETRPNEEAPVHFLVLGSHLPGIFNLGGDLRLFLQLIEAKDEDGLRRYAHKCTIGQYRIGTNFGLPICTIALVQGDALGGGFEAALANDVIIAERSASFGLPEVLFNLFPGMGAYSFLARRLDAVRAERMILSGRVHTAEELHEMGIVDGLADDGQGIEAVYQFIREFERTRRARQAVLTARKIVNPVTLQELIDIADLWVDTALGLSPGDLRRMKHLATAQNRRWARIRAH